MKKGNKSARTQNSRPQSAKINRTVGRGDYQVLSDKMDKVMKAIPRGTFSAMGGALGGPAGAAIGAGISAISGYGRYDVTRRPTVQGNSLTRFSSTVDVVPQFGQKGSVRVMHREYVSDVIVPAVPATFTNRTYRVNPGNSTTFPWLANIANNYQQYTIRGMVVEFVTTSTDYAATSALGSVILSTNYNVMDPAYKDLKEVNNSQFSVAGKPSLNILHAIECDPRTFSYKNYYTAASNVATTPTNDFALLQVVTSNLTAAAGTALGQLWISYDIELTKPIISVGSDRLVGYYAGWATSTGLPFGQSTISASLIAANSLNSSKIAYSLLNVSQETVLLITDDGDATNAKNLIRIYRPGRLTVSYIQNGTAITGVCTISGQVNCTTAPSRVQSTSATNYAEFFQMVSNAAVTYSNPATFYFDWATAPATATGCGAFFSFEPAD